MAIKLGKFIEMLQKFDPELEFALFDESGELKLDIQWEYCLREGMDCEEYGFLDEREFKEMKSFEDEEDFTFDNFEVNMVGMLT